MDVWARVWCGLLSIRRFRLQPSLNSTLSESDSPPVLYEQSLDRLVCALGGRSVLPLVFQVRFSLYTSFAPFVPHLPRVTHREKNQNRANCGWAVHPLDNGGLRYATCQCLYAFSCMDAISLIPSFSLRVSTTFYLTPFAALSSPHDDTHTNRSNTTRHLFTQRPTVRIQMYALPPTYLCSEKPRLATCWVYRK